MDDEIRNDKLERGIKFEFTTISTVSFALFQNSIPLIKEIIIYNIFEIPLENTKIVLEASPAFFVKKEFLLSTIPPQEIFKLSPVSLECDSAFLARITEAEHGQIHARLEQNSVVLASQTVPVHLLARNQWGGLAVLPESIAAFVQPNDPAVDFLLGKAAKNLRTLGLSTALNGYDRNKKEIWQLLGGIWNAVYAQEINYILPPASFEDSGQKIRNPTQVINAKLGTCLDISVLFAACLEQAGLHPILIFTKGHAFVGCWLIDDIFTSPVIDDLATLRKRISLGEVLVFETTLTTQHGSNPSFSKACECAADCIREDHSEDFILSVDISSARLQHLRPLSLFEHSVGNQESSPTPLEKLKNLELETPPDFAQGCYEMTAPQTNDPARDKMERWQCKLLDMSLRNSLLNFREGKRFIELKLPDPARLEDALSDGVRFSFVAGLDNLSALGTASSADFRNQENELFELAGVMADKKRLVIPLHQKELDDRLLTLFRASRSALEEGGANILYLSFGFLLWKEKNRIKPCKAPLVLIPVKLDRSSVKSGFLLSPLDEEPRFNLTLLEMLRRDYAISTLDIFAKELPTDAHGLDIKGIWRTVQLAVKDIEGWEVFSTVGLGLFSFAKYLMWKDLQEQGALIEANDVIRRLLDPSTDTIAQDCLYNTKELDEKLQPQKTYCPLLADSSQLAAIATAAKGKSFVLIGPPGTGKSQTITNMIAQCLGAGKTVLFVAEKTAALNVVHRRLKLNKLDEFCLELHSSKMKKLDVLRQLHDAVNVLNNFAQERWSQENRRLQELRNILNTYVRELHTERYNGLTLYRAMGIILKNSQIPCVTLQWSSPDSHGKQNYQELLDAVQQLELHIKEGTRLSDTALSAILYDDFSPMWQQNLVDSASRLRQAGTLLSKLSVELGKTFPVSESMLIHGGMEALQKLIEILPTAYGNNWAFCAGSAGSLVLTELKKGRSLLEELSDTLKTFSTSCNFTAVRAELSNIDILQQQQLWDSAKSAWWPKSFFMRRTVKKALQSLYVSGQKPDINTDLPLFQSVKVLIQNINGMQTLETDSYGLWRGLDSQTDMMDSLLEFGECIHSCLFKLGTDMEKIKILSAGLENLLGEGNALLSPDGNFVDLLKRWAEVASQYEMWKRELCKLADNEHIFTDMSIKETLAFCDELTSRASSLSEWCAWLRTRQKAEVLGLQPLIAAAVSGIVPAGTLLDAFEVNYARWWLNRTVEDIPCLRRFVVCEHENVIVKFKNLDESIRTMASQCVRANMPERSELLNAAPHEWRILKKQMTLKKRHMPIRQLLSSIPTLLHKLTPCFLMSPLSIAQYLEAGQHIFDVVIFDEASQIPIWDALGAMAHGRHVIVVGDQKQLPPTNFFQRADDEADDVPSMDADMESILDQCVGSNLPLMNLRWHYRSKHESLITFSNQQYYKGSLVTFPSPETKDSGLVWHFISGIYERGTSRTNPVEARALVAHIVERLRAQVDDNSPLSIGVVTFNTQQQTLIEDLLDAEIRNDPMLEKFFKDENLEPVLVKNLENIQGDERDIIYFSIGFGPDASGNIYMNFGALNKDGGERRLNVAITRARVELHVFSSIRADQISLEKSKAKGVSDLRLFLEYVEKGPVALVNASRGSVGEYESPFEEAVAERLQKKGWIVQPQIGVSAFRVDLGIVDPDFPGEYLAGVECDGATYHRSATARDRDRLRESVLRNLGWEIIRIWSTDWWLNADTATARLDEQLREIFRRKKRTRAGSQPVAAEQKHHVLAPQVEIVMRCASGEKPLNTKATSAPVEDASGPDMSNSCERLEQERLRKIVADIIEEEAPVHEDRLCQLYARKVGAGRVGASLRTTVLEYAHSYPQTREDVGTFYWPQGVNPLGYTQFKLRKKEERSVSEISMPELQAIARTIRNKGSDDPIVLIARKLGLQRLRAATRPRLEDAWERCQRN